MNKIKQGKGGRGGLSLPDTAAPAAYLRAKAPPSLFV